MERDTHRADDLNGNPVPAFSLGEPSLVDFLAAVEADPGLPADRKRHWSTSTRTICRCLAMPPDTLPARVTGLRMVDKIVAAAHGISDKTLSNHKSNLKAGLIWYRKEGEGVSRGAPLSPEWKAALDLLAEHRSKVLLSAFGRHCGARGIPPAGVTFEAIVGYFEHKARRNFAETGLARQRELAHRWNEACSVSGWPGKPVVVPDLPNRVEMPWEAFPEGLRRDVEAYLAKLSKPHRTSTGRRRKANKDSSINTRRREIQGFARKAVATGTAPDSLASLPDLLAPDVVTRTFEAYLGDDDKARTYTIDLAWKLHSVAKQVGAPDDAIAVLDEIRERLDDDRGPVLTEKNLKVIRTVLVSDVWDKVVALPETLMDEAERLRSRHPKKAHALATRALQILILTRAPIRIGNLMAIRFEVNLLRPGGPKGVYVIDFPDYDVKNRVDLQFPLSEDVTALIDRYIRFSGRKPKPGDFLIENEAGEQRSSAHASTAIADIVEHRTGIRVTAHQFRHAAGAIILKNRPGDYEFVRRVLGHLNIQTTTRFYTALEGFQANRMFGQMIAGQLKSSREGKR